ncbi:MAG TPA: site-2 protease family protein [Candidatus Paceibacterota bacterium]|nr:site-2 protease family protein [Candidatus Paceibacterota bacterium]
MQPELALMVFTIVILIFSVILHEVAHGYAANWLGDKTAKLAGRLTLNPLPHIDPIGSVFIPALLVLTNAGFMFGWAKPVPYNPYNLRNQRWGEAFVAAAGVLTNLFIAVLFAVIFRIADAQGADMFGMLAALVCMVNLFLGLFNLIPIPPLDGFGVLRGLAPVRMGMWLRDIEEKVHRMGILSLFLVLFLFMYVLSTPFYWLVQLVAGILLGQ